MTLIKNSLCRRLIPAIAVVLFTGFTTLPSPGDSPRPVSWQDVAEWKYIPGGSAVISNDGQWFAYWYSPNKGNSQLILQSTLDETKKSFDIGETTGGQGSGSAVQYSHDSRYLAFMVYPEEDKKEGQNSGNSSSAGLKLVDLSDFTEKSFENVKSFSFSGKNPGWLAIHMTTPKPSQDKEAGKGTDLMLTELSSGSHINMGNVADYSFNRDGQWLAWITDAWGQAGNGLQLRDMRTGRIISPENDKAWYRHLSWTKKGDGLVILKGRDDEEREDRVYSVIGLTGFDRSNPVKTVYNPHDDPEFPANMSISPNRSPHWSDNLNSLFFGIHKNESKKSEKKDGDIAGGPDAGVETADKDTVSATNEKPAVKNGEKSDVIIWHWQDSRLQSVQKNRESSDKNFSYLSVYHPKEKKFLRLADDDMRSVNMAPGQKYGLGMGTGKYELMSGLSGENFADIYIVDLYSGERSLVLEKHRMLGGLSPSPDGEKFTFYSEGNYYSCSFSSGRSAVLTENIPSSFVDEENDRNVPLPPTPMIGWSSNSREVLVRDNWNIWKISADGKKYENLTVDGAKNGKRYQYRFRLDPDEEGIDLKEPFFLRVFDEGTKQSGIARIDRGRSGVNLLLWGDAGYGSLSKAKDNDAYLFTRETVTEPPDYYFASNSDLRNPKKLTGIFPEQENFLLSPGSRLITFTGDRGDTLQAAIFLPAGYEEGKQYPAVVYIYERLTQGLNSYTRPVFPGGGFNRTMYTSNGYAVLMPDIVYELNDPGMSAVWCVLPALDAAAETGIIDPDRVAIHGHSWGGYQTSFLITQSDRFKAAVAGAPLTNMISMYSLIYWNTGSTNQPIFESSQGRLTPGYWDNYDAFRRNSPVYYARNVNTPLLLMHNDKDGAVDFTQGIEYYNTLRRLGKPVIMLQYEGENHGLRKTANQVDYAVRMMEFLDHHLKGEEAPLWISEGVPLLEMKKHLEDRPAVLGHQ